MYILLKQSKLKNYIKQAIEKAGNYKKLSEKLNIPRQKIWSYQKNNPAINKKRLDEILKYLNKNISSEEIEKKLPDNWRQIIGGKNCVKKKIKNGTLKNQLEKSRQCIKKSLANWHKELKEKDPKTYYKIQYEHFKKIGNYKFVTKKGEKVRNILEKEIADILKKLKIPYEYEPLIKAGDNYFFPDFIINKNTIVECTMWRGYDKATKLADKINKLQKKYKIYVVIPEKIKKYYELIKENLILGTKNFENLASTFS